MRILRYIRVAYRLPIAGIWTLLVHFLVIRTQQLFRPRKRCLRALQMWGAGFAWIMGVRIHKVNERPNPMGDLIVSNHMGFLDIPVLLATFPAIFVIKIELGQLPFFGGCLLKQEHIFVKRNDESSRQVAGMEIMKALQDGARVIVFPEGGGSPGAKRPPFYPGSLAVAQRLNKTVQACIIDYLPDRRMLEWDVNRKILPQVVDLFGRARTHISIEYLPAETVENAKEAAQRYHDIIESRLTAHDDQRERENAAPAAF